MSSRAASSALRDAPRCLGMDKNRFNKEVRPWVTLIPIGIPGKALCREPT